MSSCLEKRTIFSTALNRKIRNEPLGELGKSTFSLIKEAFCGGRIEDALDLGHYLQEEGRRPHDQLCEWLYISMNFIASRFGEEAVYESIRYAGEIVRRPYIERLQGLTVEERVYLQAEGMRFHRSGPEELGNIEITEERERYVISLDPCGSGGRMRRKATSDPPSLGAGSLSSPAFTSKGYPWSWGKAGVAYYCLHCCIWSEILPVEWFGYPIRITEYSDDAMEPCRFYFYKDPKLIPDHYFERIGKAGQVKA